MRIRNWVFPALIAASLNLAASGARAQVTMTLVADQASLVKTQTWIDSLKKTKIAVDHYVLSKFAKVKDKKFITIIGGLAAWRPMILARPFKAEGSAEQQNCVAVATPDINCSVLLFNRFRH